MGCLEKCLEVVKFTKIDVKLTKVSALFTKNGCKSWKNYKKNDGNGRVALRQAQDLRFERRGWDLRLMGYGSEGAKKTFLNKLLS